MQDIGEVTKDVIVLYFSDLSLSLSLSPLPPFSDGVEVVVKVFPKHDEKVQLGPYDKRLTGKSEPELSVNFSTRG